MSILAEKLSSKLRFFEKELDNQQFLKVVFLLKRGIVLF